MLRKYLAATLLVCCALISYGQTQLTDIQSPNSASGSGPTKFKELNGTLYFVAKTEKTGSELWKTDGTAAGSSMIKDINLGRASADISNLVALNNKIYFIATDDLEGGYQLWETDGTAAGTKSVTHGPSIPARALVATASRISFLVRTSTTVQVWTSDGTAGGTKLVLDIPTIDSPANLAIVGDLVFFSVRQPGSGDDTRVWRSDGTPDGTFPVSEPIDGDGASPGGTPHPTQFTEFNGQLYFLARGGPFDYQGGIMKSDGTSEGTVPIAGIFSSSRLFKYDAAVVHNGRLYFALFDDANYYYAIWSTQGTNATTRQEYEYYGNAYFSPSNMAVLGNSLYFTSGNANGGVSLMRMETTTGNTLAVRELQSSVTNPLIFVREFNTDNRITVVGDKMYIGLFSGEDFIDQILWVSDGTSAGTITVPNTRITASTIGVLQEKVYFNGVRDNDGELYTSDGTIAGTTLVKDLDPSHQVGALIQGLGVLGDIAIFRGYDEVHGYELWSTDGTPEGTALLKDLRPGESSGMVTSPQVVGNQAFFSAGSNSTREIFVTDGTSNGTRAITDLAASRQVVGQLVLRATSGDHIYFDVYSPDGSRSLYMSNGTPGNAVELKRFEMTQYGVPTYAYNASAVGNTLYFLVSGTDGNGDTFWKTDGTPVGTVKIATIGSVERFEAAGQHGYFVQTDYAQTTRPRYLKKCDGNTGEITTLTELGPLTTSAMTPVGDKLFFANSDAVHGQELWVTDGTVENTKMVKDIYEGTTSSFYTWASRIYNGMLYFAAADAAHGKELWKTDGTGAGTTLVADVLPGAEASRPYAMTSTGGLLYFTAYTPEQGFEIWSTDGQATNTRLVADVIPGATYSNPYEYEAFGDNILFLASTQRAGIQLWTSESMITGLETEERQAIVAYPNPSSGILNLNAPGMAGATMSIFTTTGYCVQTVPLTTDSAQVDMQYLPSGIYIVQCVKGQTRYARKIVKR